MTPYPVRKPKPWLRQSSRQMKIRDRLLSEYPGIVHAVTFKSGRMAVHILPEHAGYRPPKATAYGYRGHIDYVYEGDALGD